MALKASFDYYFKACRKGDAEAKAVTVNQSAVRALADASEITGLPRDNFEVHDHTACPTVPSTSHRSGYFTKIQNDEPEEPRKKLATAEKKHL
jgi:hypothetical protein